MPAGDNGELGKTQGSPPCGERENRVRRGGKDWEKEGRRQRKQESGQAVRLRRWGRKRSKARRGEGARGRRNGAPGMEEKQGAERGTRSRPGGGGGKSAEGQGTRARTKEKTKRDAGRGRNPPGRRQGSPPPVSPRPALPQSTSCPGCAAGDGRFRRRQKNTGAEARFCLREPRRSHRHFTTCRFPKSSGRHSQRVRSRTPSRTPPYPCGPFVPSSLCLRCFGERTTSPF